MYVPTVATNTDNVSMLNALDLSDQLSVSAYTCFFLLVIRILAKSCIGAPL